MEQKLKKDVLDFIDKCSKEIGKFEEDSFSQNMVSNFTEIFIDEIKSPIEQLLYCALHTVAKFNYIDYKYPDIKYGLTISPQKRIGNYRCDFKISYFIPPDIVDEVLVECDSQEFHERSEKERRYEKKRDRELTSKGFKVFHYTGSEIYKNPLIVAREILSYVTIYNVESLQIDGNIED